MPFEQLITRLNAAPRDFKADDGPDNSGGEQSEKGLQRVLGLVIRALTSGASIFPSSLVRRSCSTNQRR